MATPNAARHRDLEQRLTDLETQVRGLGSVALGRKISPVFAMSRQEDNNATTIPTAWTAYYDTESITVPAGYHKLHMIMGVSCGTSFSTTGNVSVQPIIRWNGQDAQIGSGPAISSGSSAIAVANSYWAYTTGQSIGEGSTWLTFEVGLRVVRNGTPLADSGNWHLSASIIFLN